MANLAKKPNPGRLIGLSEQANKWHPDYIRGVLLGLLLAQRGFQVDTICRVTGLSKGQLVPRLRQAGISVRDYRQLRNATSKKIVRDCQSAAINYHNRFLDEPKFMLRLLSERTET